MLITEREGFVRRISQDFRQISKPITGLPNLLAVSGQGGLLDVAVHPEYSRNGWIYISYVERQ
jgi:glucose/arabinose dehydrogenase